MLQFEHAKFRKAHLKAEQTRLEIERTKLTVRVTLTLAKQIQEIILPLIDFGPMLDFKTSMFLVLGRCNQMTLG